jgi:hypothetical protein
MKIEFSSQIFQKCMDIKFYKNRSSGAPVVPCGKTDEMKIIVAYGNLAKAPYKAIKLLD